MFIFSISFKIGYANTTLDCAPCDCNFDGSVEELCDTITGQCTCKLGVQGLKCDQCVEAFYGFSIDGCDGECFFFFFESVFYFLTSVSDFHLRFVSTLYLS